MGPRYISVSGPPGIRVGAADPFFPLLPFRGDGSGFLGTEVEARCWGRTVAIAIADISRESYTRVTWVNGDTILGRAPGCFLRGLTPSSGLDPTYTSQPIHPPVDNFVSAPGWLLNALGP